jgi:hypothetical protein
MLHTGASSSMSSSNLQKDVQKEQPVVLTQALAQFTDHGARPQTRPYSSLGT